MMSNLTLWRQRYITTSKEYLINCNILFKYFELVSLQLQLVKISCKLPIIWVNYEKTKNTVYEMLLVYFMYALGMGVSLCCGTVFTEAKIFYNYGWKLSSYSKNYQAIAIIGKFGTLKLNRANKSIQKSLSSHSPITVTNNMFLCVITRRTSNI